MFSEDGLKQMITQSVMPMPEGPIAVGKTWESAAEMDTPPFGKQITRRTTSMPALRTRTEKYREDRSDDGRQAGTFRDPKPKSS